MERCELTELFESDCAHCLHRNDPPWPAKYAGHCAVCGGGITVGAPIRWTDDGGRVQHGHHDRIVLTAPASLRT